jgi:hypothetical protein
MTTPAMAATQKMRAMGGYNPDSTLKKTLSASKEAFSLGKRDVKIE